MILIALLCVHEARKCVKFDHLSWYVSNISPSRCSLRIVKRKSVWIWMFFSDSAPPFWNISLECTYRVWARTSSAAILIDAASNYFFVDFQNSRVSRLRWSLDFGKIENPIKTWVNRGLCRLIRNLFDAEPLPSVYFEGSSYKGVQHTLRLRLLSFHLLLLLLIILLLVPHGTLCAPSTSHEMLGCFFFFWLSVHHTQYNLASINRMAQQETSTLSQSLNLRVCILVAELSNNCSIR